MKEDDEVKGYKLAIKMEKKEGQCGATSNRRITEKRTRR